MANKNTLRKRKAARKKLKRGVTVNPKNRGKFNPDLDDFMQKQVRRIQELTLRIYY